MQLKWYWCDWYQYQLGAENTAADTESENKLKESYDKLSACE